MFIEPDHLFTLEHFGTQSLVQWEIQTLGRNADGAFPNGAAFVWHIYFGNRSSIGPGRSMMLIG